MYIHTTLTITSFPISATPKPQKRSEREGFLWDYTQYSCNTTALRVRSSHSLFLLYDRILVMSFLILA